MRKITLFCLVVSCFCFAQPSEENLLLYYPFDGDALDQSGNGYDGTPFGMIFGNDRFGNPNAAAYFDGVDDFLNFPNLEELKPPLPVSFSFWIRYESETWQSQVVVNTSMEENHSTSVTFNASSDNHYVINCSDGQYFYGASSRRSYKSAHSVITQAWHHIAVVVNSETDMKIYVDCKEYGGEYSGTGGNLQYSDQPGSIGHHDRDLSLPPDFFHGYIDDFRYWSKALTENDVNFLCESLSVPDATQAVESFYVYPNPASTRFFVVANSPQFATAQVVDAYGKIIYEGNFADGIDSRDWASGVYFVKIIGNPSEVRKIVKR